MAKKRTKTKSRQTSSLNELLKRAEKFGASSISLEPNDSKLSVRFRIDGVMIKLPDIDEVSSLDRDISRRIDSGEVSRAKFFKNPNGGFYIELPNSKSFKKLSDMGYWGESLDKINQAIDGRSGLMLFCGPAGSGKSSAMAGLVDQIRDEHLKIAKLNVDNKSCVTRNSKAEIINIFKNQGADIAAVADIIDSRSIDAALQFAVSGKLLLGSIYAPDSGTAIDWLIGSGQEDFLIASSLKVIVSQRLVRKLCKHCRTSAEPTAQEQELLENYFAIADQQDISRLSQLAKSDNSSADYNIDKIWKKSKDGCDKCNHLGYSGQICIYEVLENTQEVQSMIMAHCSGNIIRHHAISSGMIDIKTDGLIKVLRGQTTLDEVMRTTKGLG